VIASPLRYPGGKAAMSGLLRQIRRLNGLAGSRMVEPFAGGAGASLRLLFLEETPSVAINDLDYGIHNFWWSLLNRPTGFLRLLRNRRVSMAEWRRQRTMYRKRGRLSRLERGFATFYLNRCNRSGIVMNGGPIGGVKQDGRWKLDARFNKAELQRRCEKVVEYRDRIQLTCLDGIDLIRVMDERNNFLFIDPPYYVKGQTLYLNALTPEYHAGLASTLRSRTDAAWVVTYDDRPEIRAMYQGWSKIRPFTLRYVAAERERGREILITPRWLQLPISQPSASISW